MCKPVYNIYRDYGTHRQLIGNLHLDTIYQIHGKNISVIDDVKMEVTVRRNENK